MAGGLATRLAERPACDLLEEPGLLDTHASLMAAELFDGRRIDRTVSWESYVASVTEPAARRRGATVPPEHPAAKRIRALIAADGGDGGDRSGDGDASRERLGIPAQNRGPLAEAAPDHEALAAYLAVSLVDAGLASWGLDWLDGVVLRDQAGVTVPTDDLVAPLAETGDATRLSEWLDAHLDVR
jgi:hypothetical protein